MKKRRSEKQEDKVLNIIEVKEKQFQKRNARFYIKVQWDIQQEVTGFR